MSLADDLAADPFWLTRILDRLAPGDRDAWLYARSVPLDELVDAAMSLDQRQNAATLTRAVQAVLQRGPVPGARLTDLLDAGLSAEELDDAVWGVLSERGPADLPPPVWAWFMSRGVEEELAQGAAIAVLNAHKQIPIAAQVADVLGMADLARFLRDLDLAADAEQLRLAVLRSGPLADVARWLDTAPFAAWDARLAAIAWRSARARVAWIHQHEAAFRAV